MRLFSGSAAFHALVAAVFSIAAFGASPAEARGRYDDRPPRCEDDHDHRAHNVDYYDFYAADRFYRAGPYRAAGVSIRGGDRYYDRGDRYYDRSGRGYRPRSEIVFRDVVGTRGAARIIVTEEIIYGRRGAQRICTVAAVGPDADFVSNRRLRRVAETRCSPRAAIRIRA